MNLKASFFSLSFPLIKENLRRFWAIPVVSFLVYFLSGVFPILMSYDEIDRMANYIQMSLQNLQPFYMGAHLLVPVLAAVILFRYLQSTSSVAVMHSLPFTRAKLFSSSFVSGLILITAPILLNGVLLLLLSKPAFRQWYDGSVMTVDPVDVFTWAAIGNWMMTSILIVLVLFSISVFTAIVTGNNLVHLLLSFFFIFLPTLLYAVFNVYFDHYLYGFSLSGDWIAVGMDISPYTGVLENQGHFSSVAILYYVATFVVLYFLSALLYRRRKLERATDALTFDLLKPILCYLITLLGMTLLGFYFLTLGESRELYLYMGFAAGTVIFFILGEMIVTKTTRIFNREGLRNFLIYVALASLFLLGLNFDFTGYERRVPNPADVQSVQFHNSSFQLITYYPSVDDEDVPFHSSESRKAIADFHRSIVDQRAQLESNPGDSYAGTVNISYETGSIFDLTRQYTMNYSFYQNNPYLKALFESKEFKFQMLTSRLAGKTLTSIYLYEDQYQEKVPEIRDHMAMDQLISCIEEDVQELTFEDYMSLRHPYVRAEIYYATGPSEEEGRQNGMGSISISIPESATRTIAWLDEHGYDFRLDPERIVSISIYPGQSKTDIPMQEKATADSLISPYEGETPLHVMTDKETIRLLLSHWDVQAIDLTNSYRIEIRYTPVNSEEAGPNDLFITGYLNGTLDFL